MSISAPRPIVVVIGGGYGGIAVAKAIDEHAQVVLVEPKDAFQHNVAALRALVQPTWLPSIFLPYDHLLAHGSVVHDRAVQVDAGRVVLGSGQRLTPDFLVLATGSTYPFPAKTDQPDSAAAIERYHAVHANLARASRVMLLGAGAVGLELAGEIAAGWPQKQTVLVDLADEILPGPFDHRLRHELERQLDDLGVERILGSPLTHLPDTAPGELRAFTTTTAAGTRIEADIWFRCYGVAPATGYLVGALSATRDSEGYVAVTPELRVVGFDTVYALGDIADLDVNRAGVAGRQAEIVATNIKAQIAGDHTRVAYTPGAPALILPLGPTGGAGQIPGREDIVTAEFVAQVKGRAMFVDRYAQILNLPVPTIAETVAL